MMNSLEVSLGSLTHGLIEHQAERDLKDHLAQTFWQEPALNKMSQHTVQLKLKASKAGDCPLGDQSNGCLFSRGKTFLLSGWNLPRRLFSLPFLFLLTPCTKRVSISFVAIL